MAQKNTHRAAGRAVTPISTPTAAARTAGGAAVLGSLLVGSVFTMQGATAQTAPAAPAAHTSSAAALPAAPATVSAKSTALSAGSTLYSGVRGQRVSALQASLNDHGAKLAVDGVFGSKTHSAVRAFQSAKGLKVDGRVGPETRGALNGGSSSSTSSAKSSTSTSGSAIVAAARSQIGVHYGWGSSNPANGLDCSGLTTYAYSQAGKSLPRTSSGQAAGGTTISQSQAKPGDIVHWPGHVAIYAGNNTVIDASGSKQQVVERTIWGSPTFISYR